MWRSIISKSRSAAPAIGCTAVLSAAFVAGGAALALPVSAQQGTPGEATLEIRGYVPKMCSASAQPAPSADDGGTGHPILDIQARCNTRHAVRVAYDPAAFREEDGAAMRFGDEERALDGNGLAVFLQEPSFQDAGRVLWLHVPASDDGIRDFIGSLRVSVEPI